MGDQKEGNYLRTLTEEIFDALGESPTEANEYVAKLQKNSRLTVLGNSQSIVCHINPRFGAFSIEFMEKLADIENPQTIGVVSAIIKEIGRQQSVKTVWLIFPMGCSTEVFSFMPGTIDDGVCEIFKDTQEKKWKMWWWTDPSPCSVPPPSTHNLGASGMLYDKKHNKVMLVKVKHRDNWCFPGGNFDARTDPTICHTGLREASEETGYDLSPDLVDQAELVAVLSFPTNQFAPAMNYVWCFRVDGLSEEKAKPCPNEVETALWVPFEELSKKSPGDVVCGHKIDQNIVSCMKNLGGGFKANKVKSWMTIIS
uniref:NUDIX domain protein n=1 Tax=Marseillevirus LCMAC101 TaxID=2506602 RepID=A0A481YSM8_9VIRU|nr:MAG: NUDIX domain protein [Marseillevirus LCMAC101]